MAVLVLVAVVVVVAMVVVVVPNVLIEELQCFTNAWRARLSTRSHHTRNLLIVNRKPAVW